MVSNPTELEKFLSVDTKKLSEIELIDHYQSLVSILRKHDKLYHHEN